MVTLTPTPTLTRMAAEHVPVLAPELVDLLDPRPGESALDGTFGGGGHARLVAERLGPGGRLVCVDRDPAAAERYERAGAGARVREPLRPRRLRRRDRRARRPTASASTAPTSTSGSPRFSSTTRPAASPTPPTRRSTCGWTRARGSSALEVVNEWPEDRLAGAIRAYGEERHSRAIAREIVRRRPIATTGELVDVIREAVPPAYRFGRGHPAKRTFQALRIAVNGELDSLERALPGAWELLEVGGRLGVISFHSLEDRRVKRFFADRARECVCPPELPVCRCSPRARGRAAHPQGRRGRAPRSPSATRARARRACAWPASCATAGATRRRARADARDRRRPQGRRQPGPSRHRESPGAEAAPAPRAAAPVARPRRRGRRARAPPRPPPRPDSDRRLRAGRRRRHGRRDRRHRRLGPRRPAHPRAAVDRRAGGAAGGHRRAQRLRAQLQRLVQPGRRADRRPQARELGPAGPDRRRALEREGAGRGRGDGPRLPGAQRRARAGPLRGDAALAARRLARGDFTIGTAAPAAPPPAAPVDPVATAPAPTAPEQAPVATETAPVAPATPAAAPAGGVTAP